MPFKVSIQPREQGVFTIAISGPLDATTYALFEEKLQPVLVRSTHMIILDMKDVNYISSLGIGSIFKALKTMKGNGGQIALANVQPQIRKVFETVKVMPHAIFKNIEEVDVYLDEIQRKTGRNLDNKINGHNI